MSTEPRRGLPRHDRGGHRPQSPLGAAGGGHAGAGVLVTGEHTGLANLGAAPLRGENPQLAPALAAQGIRFLGCDASRPHPANGPDPSSPRLPAGIAFSVGPALAVPRYPRRAYAAATRVQALDHVRHLGLTEATSWPELVDLEAGRIFATVMSNDPCPHYFHQSNLATGRGDESSAGGRVFYALLDARAGALPARRDG